VFWTGSTKSGCAGQYSDCFSEGNNDGDKFEGTILPSDNGGACVGFAMSGDDFVAKSMPCDRKLFLGCQSLGTRSEAMRKNVNNLNYFSNLLTKTPFAHTFMSCS
jgi:hypothetical protein